MPQIKPQSNPGFISQATQVQAQGAWYDGNLVRWRFGLLEKIGGWQRLIEETFAAPIRQMHAWTDLEDYKNLLVATDLGLQIIVNNTQYGLGAQIDLQGGFIPSFGPSADTTKFSATAGSKTVTVKTNRFVTAGGTILLQLPISIGGRILPAGSFFVIKSVTLGVGFTFDMPMPALVNETDAYGVRLYTNDIINSMTVTWKAHGLVVGEAFEVAQTTTLKSGAAVDFTASAKRLFRVESVPSVDTFTFSMGAAGTGDGAGGISHQVYEGSEISPTGTAVGTVIGVAALKPLSDPQKQSWFLDNLGQDGLALASGGPLQVYTPPIDEGPWISPVGSGSPATAPQKSNGMLVAMPQAQVILWGTEAIMGSGVIDPLLVRFSDVGTYDKYTAAVSNQAGSYRLGRGSKIMGAIQAPQMTLIWTDTDLWSMSYIGPPLIYGFTIVARGCGLDAPHDVGVLGTAIIWKSKQNFWIFGGGGAQVLPCSVWDYAFKNIDLLNINKSFAAPNSSATEIGFYFAAASAAKEAEERGEGGNLLLFSNDLTEATRWLLTGAAAIHPSLFKHVYLYEPQYIRSGWFDDSGLNPISWLDDDVQMQLEQVIFAPDGTDTATLLQEFAITGEHSIAQTINKPEERKTYTLSLYAHNSSTRNLTLRASSAAGVGVYATFNPATGALVTSGVTSSSFSLISAVMATDALGTGSGNGWRRYIMTFTSDDKPKLTVTFNNTNGTSISYLGDVTKGCLIWGPQLVEGTLPLEYQITTGFQPQNEPALYVKFNPLDKAWDSGKLARTAWIDDSVWGTPLGADANFRVQQHERGYDADDEPMRGVFAETGYAELGDGTIMLSINECQPDFKWFGRDGAMKVSLRAQNYAGGPDHLYGPWSMTPGTQFFCPRVRGRRVAIRYEWEGLRGYSARVGTPSYLVKPAGKRP